MGNRLFWLMWRMEKRLIHPDPTLWAARPIRLHAAVGVLSLAPRSDSRPRRKAATLECIEYYCIEFLRSYWGKSAIH